MYSRSLPFLFFLLWTSSLLSQSDDYFIVDAVQYIGNDKTAERVINNELDILPGDTVYLRNLSYIFESNEKRILSTGLFTQAKINIKNWRVDEQLANIEITLQENWYIYPSFIFELADRNFSVWWNEQNRDLSRINYGLSLDHINLTGNRDKLKLKFQRGYTHKYEANYRYPYINKYWGASGELFYATQKEIGYITQENKTLFRRADDERQLLSRFRTGVGIQYRPSIFFFHESRLEYHHNSIDPLVATEYNPDYFTDGATDLQFFILKYNFLFDKRRFTLYPDGGYAIAAQLKKEGLGLFGDFNNLSIDASYEQHISLTDRLIFGAKVKAKTNLIRNEVAFANNTGLGYGDDYLRGYELYVMDGTDWVYLKTNLRYNVLTSIYNLKRAMPLRQLKTMPFQFYLRIHAESGIVHEPTYTATNTLNDRLLFGYGLAADFILWNTALLSIEYSFNHLGESGLYLLSTFNF